MKQEQTKCCFGQLIEIFDYDRVASYFHNSFNDQRMFKNMEKRFEYDINPPNTKDFDRLSNKHNVNGRNYPQNYQTATTPHQKRSFINTSLQEERDRQNISIQESFFNGPTRNQEKYQRGRVSSASGLKRSVDKVPLPGRSGKSQYAVDENCRQAKKVYFGGDDSYTRQIEMLNPRSEQAKYGNKTEEMKKYRGEDQRREEVDPFILQENINYSNTRIDMSKQKPKRYEPKNEPEFQVNQKEIVQKINRINRLNEQINSRLQRMLNKIDNS